MALLDDFQQQIDRRLDELRPAFTEYSTLQQLRSAIANLDPEAAIAQMQQFALTGATTAVGSPANGDAAPSPDAGAAADDSAASPAPRRRKTATRAAKDASSAASAEAAAQHAQTALELVSTHPGLTAVQLAKRMGVPASVLFRLLPTLQRDGRIRKQGKGYLPT